MSTSSTRNSVVYANDGSTRNSVVYCYHATSSGTTVKLRCVDRDGTALLVMVDTPGYQLVPYDPELEHLALMSGPRHMIIIGQEVNDGVSIDAHMGLALHRDIQYTGSWIQLIQHHGTPPVIGCTYDDVIAVQSDAPPPTLTMYWDIETMSTVVGDYPDHQRQGDAVCIITFSQGHTGIDNQPSVRTYMLQTVAERMSQPLSSNVVVYDDEIAMITDFLNLMKQYTHTVSFNGMGYDMDYLVRRELLLTGAVANHSRVRKLRSTYHYNKAGWRSGLVLKQPEIVHIDLLLVVQTLLPDLPSHKLNLVCGLLLGEHKDDVDFHTINGILNTPSTQLTDSQRDTMTRFATYAAKDTALLVKLWQWLRPHCQQLCTALYSPYTMCTDIKMVYEWVSLYVSMYRYPAPPPVWSKKWRIDNNGMCPLVYYYTLAPWYRMHCKELMQQWPWLQLASSSDLLAVLCGVCIGMPSLVSSAMITTSATAALSSGTFDDVQPYGYFDRVLSYNGQVLVTTGGNYYHKSPLRSPLLELRIIIEQLATTGTMHTMTFNMNGVSHELVEKWRDIITTVLK